MREGGDSLNGSPALECRPAAQHNTVRSLKKKSARGPKGVPTKKYSGQVGRHKESVIRMEGVPTKK